MNSKQQAISGTKWTTMSTLTTAVVGVLRLAVLTRFLEREDFGIVAIIVLILGFTHVFSDLGFSVSIMSKKTISRTEFSSVYWLQFIIFLFLFGLISYCSPYIASFYDEESLSVLLPIALIDLIFWGVGRLYETVLQKNFKFKIIAIRNIISAILSLVLAYVLAYFDFGVYSMILSTLFHTLVLNIWNFVSGQKIIPLKCYLSFIEIKPFFKVGIYQTGAQILDYFSAKFDILIIGKFFGTEVLGVYSLAKELVLKLIFIINSIANKVALPFFALNNENDVFLRENYCRLIRILSFINFPICVALSVFSNYIVYILYGKDYLEVAPLVFILSFYAMMVCLGNPVGTLALSKGRTDISFQWTVLRILTAPIIVYFAALYSIKTVAVVQVVYTLVLFVVGWRMLIYRLIKLKLSDYIKSFGGMGVISITVALIFVILVHFNLFLLNDYWTQVVVYGISFCAVYSFFVYFFLSKQVKELINFIRK